MTRHLDAQPPTGDPAATNAGELNATVARAVVRIYHAHAGRGPTKARAFFHAETLVVLLEHVMTTPERTLVQHGRQAAARAVREQLQAAMREELVEAVEAITGGTVRASLSDSDVEADVATEVFVLDRPLGVVASRLDPPAS
ncbi:MAG TPA: DUF2294 domain-containing protein [Solirubrobacteraceae bacterium]